MTVQTSVRVTAELFLEWFGTFLQVCFVPTFKELTL